LATAFEKSLPKREKTGEKGRKSQCRRPEISTQTAGISQKGRDSRSPRPEISTQTAEISQKGRDSRSPRPEISTQIAKIGRKGRDSNFLPSGNLYPNSENRPKR